MGVRWKINKTKYTNAVLAITKLNDVIFEKDVQIFELNSKLFIIDETLERYRFNINAKTDEAEQCALKNERLKSWVTIGKVGTVVICAGATVAAIVIIKQEVL